MHKIIQLGRFPCKLLRSLLKTGLPLMKNVLKLLAQNVLIPLALTAPATATDAAVQKKRVRSGNATLITFNKEMKNVIKTINPLEECSLLLKSVSKTIEKDAKEQKGGFLLMLLGNLGASLLGNLWTGKDTIRAAEGIVTTSHDFWYHLIL